MKYADENSVVAKWVSAFAVVELAMLKIIYLLADTQVWQHKDKKYSTCVLYV
jgi:hypothetical protein